MNKETTHRYWFLFYRILGTSINGYQAYKYFTDRLELSWGEALIFLLAGTLTFTPLLIPKILRIVVNKISSTKTD